MHLTVLYNAVSWALLHWHRLFVTLGIPSDNGWTWTLSIVFLVITVRLLLLRLFVRQVHHQRAMQKIQPLIQQVRETHKDDRAQMSRAIMTLHQSAGVHPFAGCLPMLLQIPVFVGLHHVLRHLTNSNRLCRMPAGAGRLLELYTFSGGRNGETCSAARAHVFASPLAASFRDGSSTIMRLGGDPFSTHIVLVVLLLLSAGATFATQLLVRAGADTPPEGSTATVQRLTLWAIPIGTLASGLLFAFPLGVLLYWCTSNLWTLGQQAYITRSRPPTDGPRKHVDPAGPTPVDDDGSRASPLAMTGSP